MEYRIYKRIIGEEYLHKVLKKIKTNKKII